MVHEMEWWPVYAPSKADAYQYDSIQKVDLPYPVYRSIQYTVRHVHGLRLHPPDRFRETRRVHGQCEMGPERVIRSLPDDRLTPGGLQRQYVGERIVNRKNEVALPALGSLSLSQVQGHDASSHGGQLGTDPTGTRSRLERRLHFLT